MGREGCYLGELEAVYLPEGVKTRFISDGYHTFDELYQHRMALTAQLMRAHPNRSWRSKQHSKKGSPMFDGFFIVGMNLPTGMITYHYKLEYWDIFEGVKTVVRAPAWDGHTPADVVQRLLDWK